MVDEDAHVNTLEEQKNYEELQCIKDKDAEEDYENFSPVGSPALSSPDDILDESQIHIIELITYLLRR